MFPKNLYYQRTYQKKLLIDEQNISNTVPSCDLITYILLHFKFFQVDNTNLNANLQGIIKIFCRSRFIEIFVSLIQNQLKVTLLINFFILLHLCDINIGTQYISVSLQ